ncbi:MAG TPA: tetratricopeptide repeat protein [Myxococcaceae bacterium]|jgi:tetratricopeptide (TPR) repeat protein
MASKRRPARRRPSARKKPASLARIERREAPAATPVARAVPVPVHVQHFPKRPVGVMSVEVEPTRVEETLAKIREELTHWAKKGRHTKVRFKLRGKQLLPDIPLAAVVAGEALTFYWGGLLRALVVNFAGNALFKVELVNDSEKKVATGKEQLLLGELDRALALFQEAVEMDRESASAHLNMGIALKLKGDRAAARTALERAKSLDPHGAFGSEAERILLTMTGGQTATVSVV